MLIKEIMETHGFHQIDVTLAALPVWAVIVTEQVRSQGTESGLAIYFFKFQLVITAACNSPVINPALPFQANLCMETSRRFGQDPGPGQILLQYQGIAGAATVHGTKLNKIATLLATGHGLHEGVLAQLAIAAALIGRKKVSYI